MLEGNPLFAIPEFVQSARAIICQLGFLKWIMVRVELIGNESQVSDVDYKVTMHSG